MLSEADQLPDQSPEQTDTVQQILIAGVRRLLDSGIEGASRDARLLMAHALHIEVGRLTLHTPDEIDAAAQISFNEAISRRVSREPMSHILGKRHFFGRDFIVTPDVLDPRPETEILIAQALQQPFNAVLDMGTGSGVIILTLLAENQGALGVGSDLSQDALNVARRNAEALTLQSRATFQESDWFEGIELGQCFDLIVSNPPYITTQEMSGLSPELSHEPRMALTDEADGLTPYRIICARVLEFLTPMGRILFEIGPTQGGAVSDMLAQIGCEDIRILADFDGRDRVVCAKAPK